MMAETNKSPWLAAALTVAAALALTVMTTTTTPPPRERFVTQLPKYDLPPGIPTLRPATEALPGSPNRDEMEATPASLSDTAQGEAAGRAVGLEPIPSNFATTLAGRAGELAAHLTRIAVPKHGYSAVQKWLRAGGALSVFERIVSGGNGTLASFGRISYSCPRGWGEAAGSVLRDLDARLKMLEDHLQKGAKVLGPNRVLDTLRAFNEKTFPALGYNVRALFAAAEDVAGYGYSDSVAPGEAWVCLRMQDPKRTDADSLMGTLLHELSHVITDRGRDALAYDRSGHDEVFLKTFQYLQKHALASGALTPASYVDRNRGGTLRVPDVPNRGYYAPRQPPVSASGPVVPEDWLPDAQKIIFPESGLSERDGKLINRFLMGTTIPVDAALAKGAREFGAAMESSEGPNWLANLKSAASKWEEKGE